MYQQDIPLNIKAKNCPCTVQLVFNHYFLLFPSFFFFFFFFLGGGGGVIFCVLLSFLLLLETVTNMQRACMLNYFYMV